MAGILGNQEPVSRGHHPAWRLSLLGAWQLVGADGTAEVGVNGQRLFALPLPADASLVQRVQAMVNALTTGPADSALVGLAFTLASAIDGMDADVRSKMIGQTSGAMLNVLKELRIHAPATPRPYSHWDEMRPGAVAARR